MVCLQLGSYHTGTRLCKCKAASTQGCINARLHQRRAVSTQGCINARLYQRKAAYRQGCTAPRARQSPPRTCHEAYSLPAPIAMDDAYTNELLRKLSYDVRSAMQRAEMQRRAQPKATLHTRFGKRDMTLSGLASLLNTNTETVLLVEDINLTWMKAVGKSIGVDPAFFVDHAREPFIDCNPWTAIMGATPTQTIQESREQLYSSRQSADLPRYWNIDGIFTSLEAVKTQENYQLRTSTWTRQYGLQVTTRLSVWSSKNISKCRVLWLPS